jgi:hypothetical protein
MTDIVERAWSYEVGNLVPQKTWVREMHELADEIERLGAERDEWIEKCLALQKTWVGKMHEAADEIERLQMALKEVANVLGDER